MKKTFSLVAMMFLSAANMFVDAKKDLMVTDYNLDELKRSLPQEEFDASVDLINLDKPVFLFKTTAKDPYFIIHRPGSNVLEIVMFGYYPGKGTQVYRVSKPEHCSMIVPIRQTKLFIDGPVKIDEKFPGYREAFIAKAFESMLQALCILPEHYYKGNPFVDQYIEGIPSKWVFNDYKEFSAFRTQLEASFKASDLISKKLPKPVLVLEIEAPNCKLSQNDYEFLNTYFTLSSLSNPILRSFFVGQQEQIIEAISKIKDAKQVKEGFADAMFRQIESMTNEFKVKEMAVAGLTAIVTAVTLDLAKGWVRELGAHAKQRVDHGVVNPVLNRVKTADHPLRNAILIGSGAALLGVAAVGVGSQFAD